jgi:hypothetical protein
MKVDKKDFNKIMEKLGEVLREVKLNVCLKKNNTAPRYSSLADLMMKASTYKLPCHKFSYDCNMCDIKKRNKCWSIITKINTKKLLISNLPYDKQQLTEMGIPHLWMLSSYFKITTISKSKHQLIKSIYDKQVSLKMINERNIPAMNWTCRKCGYQNLPLSKWPVKDKIKHCPDCGISMHEMPLLTRRKANSNTKTK